MKHIIALLLLCGVTTVHGADLDRIAGEYLVLELAMAEHDPAHVDAYFGPDAYREKAEAAGLSLAAIFGEAQRLRDAIAYDAMDGQAGWVLGPAREQVLAFLARHMETLIEMNLAVRLEWTSSTVCPARQSNVSPSRPPILDSGPCQENVVEDINLNDLPILLDFWHDG